MDATLVKMAREAANSYAYLITRRTWLHDLSHRDANVARRKKHREGYNDLEVAETAWTRVDSVFAEDEQQDGWPDKHLRMRLAEEATYQEGRAAYAEMYRPPQEAAVWRHVASKVRAALAAAGPDPGHALRRKTVKGLGLPARAARR